MKNQRIENRKRKWVAGIFVIFLAFTLCFGTPEVGYALDNKSLEEVFDKTESYLVSQLSQISIGSTGGDWIMYGLGIGGYEFSEQSKERYVQTVRDALEEGYRGTKGILHDRKYTEYSRVVVALSAIGKDATNVGGCDLVEKLSYYDKVVWQGINGPIWALIALDMGGYDLTSYQGGATRQQYVDVILKHQLADGGWNIAYDPEDKETELKADPDMTGMALIALAPYWKQEKVKKAANKAIDRLSKIQASDGCYQCYGAKNVESCAQVICGLVSWGINPQTDSRFIKNGNKIFDAFLTFYDGETGGFRHVNIAQGGYEPVVNQMATEQAFYTLAGYFDRIPRQVQTVTAKSTKEKRITVGWSKTYVGNGMKEMQVDGYQIVLATDKNFSKNKVTLSTKGNQKKATVSKLKSGKTYYVKVRAYKVVSGKKCYGPESVVKKIKVK